MSKQSIRHFVKTEWDKLNQIIIGNLCIKIESCDVENESVALLIKNVWKKLSMLSLSENPIDDSCLDILHRADWCKLDEIKLNFNDLMTQMGTLTLAKGLFKKISIVHNLKKAVPKSMKNFILFK